MQVVALVRVQVRVAADWVGGERCGGCPAFLFSFLSVRWDRVGCRQEGGSAGLGSASREGGVDGAATCLPGSLHASPTPCGVETFPDSAHPRGEGVLGPGVPERGDEEQGSARRRPPTLQRRPARVKARSGWKTAALVRHGWAGVRK